MHSPGKNTGNGKKGVDCGEEPWQYAGMTAKDLIQQLRQRHTIMAISDAIKMDERNVQRLAAGKTKGRPAVVRFLWVLVKCPEARKMVGL